jgi:catechol 2,3-dioxygenase-like lactoylglutathione lyase family enzyme
MSVELNHHIVRVRDKEEAARFFAEILGLPPATRYGPFLELKTANGVSLDFADDHGEPVPAHYAFLVSETEFDEIFGRIKERGLGYWADPGHRRPNAINTNDGGRGVYWDDPNGNVLEIITRPYGSGG